MGHEPLPAIERRERSRGTVYGLRVRDCGRRYYVHLGGSWEGWTAERVEDERRLISKLVERGEWVPPQSPTTPLRANATVPTFEAAALELLAKKTRRGAKPKTLADLRWRFETGLDHFGALPVDQIDAACIEAFVDKALAERAAIEQAAAAGEPLLEAYEDPRTGRRHTRRRRSLSNSSINKVIGAVRAVLREAQRHGHIVANPASDPDLRVRESRPERSFLQVEQIAALLEAGAGLERRNRGLDWDQVDHIRASPASAVAIARELGVSDVLIGKVRRGELWIDQARRNRNDVPRVAVLATLVLAGLRIEELCGLRGEHLDFARGVLRVARETTKTDAGVREVPMLPALRELLTEHVTARPMAPDEPVFATRNGRRNTTDNVRRIVVDQSVELATELLTAHGRPPIRRCTPHSLRRTFASILAEVGVAPRRAMYLLGHTDPKLTMGVYQQVLDLGADGPEVLEEILGCDLDDALTVLSGRASRRPFGQRLANATPSERETGEPAAGR